MDNKVQIVIEAYNKTKAAFADLDNSLNQTLGKATEFGSKVQESASRAGAGIAGLETAFKKLLATLGIGISFDKVIKSIDLSIAAEQAEESFRLVSAASEESAGRVLDAMRRMTAGTIEDSSLMQKAVKGMSLGLKGDDLIAIAGAARTSARIIGTSVGEAFDRIIDAVSTNMPKALKQVGLITQEQMNLFNRAIASGADGVQLLDIVVANAGKQLEKLGQLAETDAEKVQRLKVFLVEKLETFGAAWVTSFDMWGKTLSDLLEKARELRDIIFGAPLNELGRPEVTGKIPPMPESMKNPQTPKAETPEQVMARWKAAIDASGAQTQALKDQEKFLAEVQRLQDEAQKTLGIEPPNQAKRLEEGLAQAKNEEEKFLAEVVRLSNEAEKSVEEPVVNMADKLEQALKDPDKYFGALSKKAKDTSEEMKTAITGWASKFSTTLNDTLWAANFSFGDIAKSFAKMITDMIIQTQVVQPLLDMLFGGSSAKSSGGGFDFFETLLKGASAVARLFSGAPDLGGAGSGASNMGILLDARGGVFDRTGPIPFGRGGVVSSPSLFRFAGGAGLMGEAGPEGILPLGRLPSGELGVKSQGGGIAVHVHNYVGAKVTTKNSLDGRTLEIFIERKVLDTINRNPRNVAGAVVGELHAGNRSLINAMKRTI